MTFLSNLKKSLVKPKIMQKENREDQEMEPISNGVENLLQNIGKKVYGKEIEKVKEWLSRGDSKGICPLKVEANKNAFKYLRAFLKWGNTFSKKQTCLIRVFQNLKEEGEEREVIVEGLYRLQSKEVFIQLLILSRLGSQQASRLLKILN